jgi:hypothetical protein
MTSLQLLSKAQIPAVNVVVVFNDAFNNSGYVFTESNGWVGGW